MLATAGICWQVLASAGRFGGMRGAARLRQKLSEFDRFLIFRFHHALLPFGGGGFNRSAHSAGPTPKACGLVSWFFGVLVVGVCLVAED